MNIIEKKIIDLIPYEKNPRNNEEAIGYVANSIKEFGFKSPVIVDKNNIIVAGHTRILAAKELKMETVPCIVADDLTEEQVKAYRLADNKVAEFSTWDLSLLDEELSNIIDIDMGDLGFNHLSDIDWADVEDLSEETYEKPEKDMLECPHCHHIDSKVHFRKVDGVEIAEKIGEEQ